MEQEADDGGADSQQHHQRRHVLEGVHLLQEQAHQNEDESVAGIAHTEGEEQQEEHADEGSGVEAVVARASVHIRKDLELLDKPVVAEADGRVVFHHGVFLQVIDAGLVQGGRNGIVLFRGGIAHQRDDGVFCCGNGRCAGQV